MVVQQRVAVFNLVIALIAVVCFGALLPVLGVMKAQGMFGVLGFSGFAPLFYLKRRPVVDERDQMLQLKAFQITFVVLWLLFVAAVWTACMVYTTAVPRELVVLGAWLAWCAFLISHSTTLLILYGRS